MKSRINLAIVLTTIAMTTMLTACGNTQDNTKVESSPSTIASEPVAEEITLPEPTETKTEATVALDAAPVFEPVIPETISSTPDTYIDAPTGVVVNKEKTSIILKQ